MCTHCEAEVATPTCKQGCCATDCRLISGEGWVWGSYIPTGHEDCTTPR